MEKRQEPRLGAAEIASMLRRDIHNGVLADRQRLPPERDLAKSYDVARGTVRDALAHLAHEGLLEIRPGSGTYVAAQQIHEASTALENGRPLELMDARFALEPHICRLAVLHATDNDFRRAEALLAKMDNSTNDPIAFSQADAQLHTLLVESTNNTILIWIVRQINLVRNQKQWSHMRNVTLNAETIALYNEQHRAIVEAIQLREPEVAAQHMKVHLESARLSLTRAADT